MIKKIAIISVLSLLAFSAMGLTLKDLRSPQTGDLRLKFLQETRTWVNKTERLVKEEMKVIQALKDREMITTNQRATLISKYETAIQTQWQARPTMQDIIDEWNVENPPDEK